MFAFMSRPLNAIRGIGNSVSASWTSSMAGKSLRGAMLGGRNVRNWGMIGAGVGAGAGAAMDGDNRVGGAIKGGLLGAGLGMGGAMARNNWGGLRRLASSATEGARRSW